MTDGLTAVLSRIAQIRAAFGTGTGGTLGVSDSRSSDSFERYLRDATGSTGSDAPSSTSSSGGTAADPLERLGVPTGTSPTGSAGSTGSTGRSSGIFVDDGSWPSGVPEEADRYRAEFLAASQATGVPLRILLAVSWAESAFNPTAGSGAGAIGMMQLMPGTAAGLGVDPYDPGQNIMGGARYLAAQYAAFGSWDLAFAAYNAGPGAVQQYGGIPPYAETQSYVAIIDSYLERIGPAGPAVPAPSEPVLQAIATPTVPVVPVVSGEPSGASGRADDGTTDPSTILAAAAAVPTGTSAAGPGPATWAATAALDGSDQAIIDVLSRGAAPPGAGNGGATPEDAGATADLAPAAAPPVALGTVAVDGTRPSGGFEIQPGTSIATAVDPGGAAVLAAGSNTASTATSTASTSTAGNVSGSTLTATPATLAERLTAVLEHGRGQSGTKRVTVRLDPPELGALHVSFELKGDQVHLVVRPERAEATQIVNQQRERIAAALAGEGLELSGFEIGGQATDPGGRQPGDGRSADVGQAYRRLETDAPSDVVLNVDRELRL